MEERAIRGVVWTFLSYGGNKIITLLTTLALARLLVPADFGVVSLAAIVVGFFNLFRDLGLTSALISRPGLDNRTIGTLFSLILASSTLMAGVVAIGAPVASSFFDAPGLTAILPALAVTLVLGAFGGFYDALLQRDLNFRPRFIGQTASGVAYAAVALTLAVGGFGAWSLVAGQAAQALVSAAVLMSMAPRRVLPCLDRSRLRGIFAASRGFLLQGVVAFVHLNVGAFAVGRMLTTTQVGYYTTANRLAEIPNAALAEPVANVTFPGFARMRHRGEDVTSAFLSTLRLIALLTAPLGVLLSATADPFTRVVLGQQWMPAIPLLTLLGLWAVFRPLGSTVGWFLNSMGLSGLLGVVSLCVVVPLVPALLLAAHFYGLVGVSVVLLVDVTVTQLLLTRMAARRCGVSAAAQWRALRAVLLAAGVTWVTARLSSALLSPFPAILVLAASVAAGLAAYLGVIAISDSELLHLARSQVKRILGARAAA